MGAYLSSGSAGRGDDTVVTLGSMYVEGDEGDDTLIGGDGHDNLDAGSGEDVVFGMGGTDFLYTRHDGFADTANAGGGRDGCGVDKALDTWTGCEQVNR
jgi:Ca2+-binding RTX toxin-like protein